MTDYFQQLDVIKTAGHQHAVDHMGNGATIPQENLFSGEWADGLTGQDAIDYAEKEQPGLFRGVIFDRLEDFERDDVIDSFTDGYNAAPWPERVDLWPEATDA